ncbi:MAG: DEAD/DEAH box helicase [Microgenomates group bacterium GW2011_GWA2_37_6]|nr:MAG: DEAD/DEAH box helicase [Microgenomates group bacterium GW2011_GWA2_37_6]
MYSNNNHRNKNQRSRQKYINPAFFVNKPVYENSIISPPVKHEFADFLIADQIKINIRNKGYMKPTPIQDQVIPYVLEGRDVIGLANTGTGKTGAFLIPLVNKVLFNRSEKVLVVAPTRELAVQINEELKIFARDMNIFSVLCIGGTGLSYQISALRKPHDFVIGTPGRIKDLKNQGKLNLALYNNIVLDEVDRMMDMGFINDMKFIISHLPGRRQSLFFSATLPREVMPIAQIFLRNPIAVSVKSQETAQNIEQDVVKLAGRNKVDVLHDLLTEEGFDKVLVFGRTKWGIEKLSKALQQRGFRALAIHGNKNQNQRQRALDQFKRQEIQVLLATDVASRGLDIDDVTHVINYDQPASYEDYVHRIGRTGRADKKGKALTFIE